ncbi:gamma-glutamyltransferase 1 Threonine peptidase. MEROPS family T03 [Rhizobiales bacterium GAS191]|nr:gamma-glutamyltransferase 1 Threonine peptidase. MEROPS family T03 [Rhizobiales bacterium GAS113]SEE81981.1 gamma-glutamyltransferase 1 Threonine peptidase. MEROPS family T03 [Rhizobiales bacterium GAS191]
MTTLLRMIATTAMMSLPCAALAASPAPVGANHGIVVTGQHLASQVGADILKQGGNAVDAAVAVGYALAVVYPAAGNLGGGGFMNIRLADGRSVFLDFREKAPLASTKTMYQDANGKVVPGLSTEGWLAVGVPGSVAGFETALREYGTLPRAKVMEPAIALARDGFELAAGDVALLLQGTEGFRKNAEAAAIFLKDGKPYEVGDRLIQKNLAKTLETINNEGADAFYKGPIGDAIVAASKAGHGLFEKADLERYKVRQMKPVECNYRGYEIHSSPPPSSGGVIICEILDILEGYDLNKMGFHSAQEIHVMAEAMRHAYVDRNNKLGDPDFVNNPLAELLDKGYATKIRTEIPETKATPSSDLGPGRELTEGKQTTHYSIADAEGNAVAVTYTLNDWFGTKIVAGDTGILMNNEMDDFTAKPGVPNMFGLVQGEANAIAPGKTPLSSMSPTIITKDGKLVMVIGSPGGSRIITITLEAIINVIDHGMTVQEAIDAPRIHEQWLPDTLYTERLAVSPDTQRALEAMGYTLKEVPPWGLAEGILVGGPSLGAHGDSGDQPLNLGLQSAIVYKLFGANDDRGPAGSASGY